MKGWEARGRFQKAGIGAGNTENNREKRRWRKGKINTEGGR